MNFLLQVFYEFIESMKFCLYIIRPEKILRGKMNTDLNVVYNKLY